MAALCHLLSDSARSFGDKTALQIKRGYRNDQWSYRYLSETSERIANHLKELGIHQGERVLVLAPNMPEWVGLFFGCLRAGVILVPLDVRSSPDFMAKVQGLTEARCLFMSKLLERQAPNLGVPTHYLEDLRERIQGADVESGLPYPDENDIAEIMFTSGTTGDPKGVILTHNNIMSNVVVANSVVPSKSDYRVLSLLPLSHMLEQTVGLLVWFLIFQGLREYSRLVDLPDSYRRILLAAGVIAPIAALLSLDAFLFLPPVILILATLQPILLHRESGGVRHLAFAVLGWGYIAWFLTHIMLLYKYIDGGPGIILAIGLAVALSDVGAFTLGSTFGKHKMSPRVSPNKTWEGAVGNLVGAFAGIGIMSFALPKGDLFWGMIIVLPVVIALGSIWGDLLESVIKREFEVKDAGAWLPGFGGLLDRIDSLIIVVPLVFYVLKLIGSV